MNFQQTNKHKTLLEDFYDHFDEEHRLDTRHGQVEFITNIKYIMDFIPKGAKILDIGAATGKYSIFLKEKGYDVVAFELLSKHINIFKTKTRDIPIFQGNALDLAIFEDNSFDCVLLFGPLYHLLKKDERLKALKEAKRVVKKGGYIFASYLNNEYAIISYGFKKNNIVHEMLVEHTVDDNFITKTNEKSLYCYLSLNEISNYNDILNLHREKIIASDGASDYLRTELNKLDDVSFNIYLTYHLSRCENQYLLGASSHFLDILKKMD